MTNLIVLDSYPSALVPRYATSTVNEPVTITSHSIVLTQDDEPKAVDATLRFSWLPYPAVEFTLEDVELSLGPTKLKSSSPAICGKFRVVRTGSQGSTIRSVSDRVVVNHTLSEKPTFVAATLHFVNLPDIPGEVVRSGDVLTNARQQWRFGEWTLTMDSIRLPSGQAESAQASRGYVLTHVVRVQKTDRTEFRQKHLLRFVDDLWIAMAFAFGRRLGPILIACENLNGLAMEIFCPFSGRGWTEPHRVAPIFSEFGLMLESLASLCAKENWAITREAIYWYLEANSTMLNASIVLAQASLERLSFDYLVNVQQLLSNEAYDRLNAGDCIRLLMTILGIPISVPDHENIKWKEIPDKKHKHIPELITLVRNAQAHPGRPGKSAYQGTSVLLWANKHALETVELTILRLANYHGLYHPRGVGFATEHKVPWAS